MFRQLGVAVCYVHNVGKMSFIGERTTISSVQWESVTYCIYNQASKASPPPYLCLMEARYIRIYYKYSTLPRGISVYITPKVGIFSQSRRPREIFSTEGAIYAVISQGRVEYLFYYINYVQFWSVELKKFT